MISIVLHQRAAVMHVVLPALGTYAIPFDALNEEFPLSYRVHIWYGKLEWLDYNLVKVA